MRCGAGVAPLRAEPRDDAEQVSQLLPREPVDVEALAGEWARVVTAYAYPGWVRVDALEEGEGSLSADAEGSPLEVARGYLGSRYLWGGMTSAGIDCSGLVHMTFRRLGMLIPRDAWQQEQAGEPVDLPEPGDLVTYGDGEADHVAFWVGDGRILHSTGRDGGLGVVEETEPPELHVRRRVIVRFRADGVPKAAISSLVRGNRA